MESNLVCNHTLRSGLISLITHMIADRTGRHDVLLPSLIASITKSSIVISCCTTLWITICCPCSLASVAFIFAKLRADKQRKYCLKKFKQERPQINQLETFNFLTVYKPYTKPYAKKDEFETFIVDKLA